MHSELTGMVYDIQGFSVQVNHLDGTGMKHPADLLERGFHQDNKTRHLQSASRGTRAGPKAHQQNQDNLGQLRP